MPLLPLRPAPPAVRLGLNAYSLNQGAVLHVSGARLPATLITLSNLGARLKAPGRALGLALGERGRLDLVAGGKGLKTGDIPCRIVWIGDREVEVAFSEVLPLAMGEVQAAVDF